MVVITVNGKHTVLLTQRIKTNIGVVILAAVTLTLLSSSHASAQSNTTNSANTLKVAPVRSDIQIKPGETQKVPMTLSNLTSAPIRLSAIGNDFIAGDERGTPALILDADKFAPSHSLKRFMKPVADVVIPAKQTKVVDVLISVPKDAQGGGYFGAVRFAPKSEDGGGQVNLTGSVASLVLLTVPGPVTEKMDLTNFEIQQSKKTGTHFQSSNDLTALVRFQNKGGLQQGPFGKISVLQGDKVVYQADFNDKTPRDMILPDSARRWDVPLKNIGSFGNYTVKATFTYGSKNQTIEVEKSFWVIPQFVIFMTIGAVIVLLLIIVGIWLFVRSRMRRKSRGQGHRGGFRR